RLSSRCRRPFHCEATVEGGAGAPADREPVAPRTALTGQFQLASSNGGKSFKILVTVLFTTLSIFSPFSSHSPSLTPVPPQMSLALSLSIISITSVPIVTSRTDAYGGPHKPPQYHPRYP